MAIHADRINEVYARIPYESYAFRAVGLEPNGRGAAIDSTNTNGSVDKK
jgi:hypothetical protein